LDVIYIVYTILLSLLYSGVWDVVKQNLLDKDTILNLNIVITELSSVHDHIKKECNIKETEEKQKTEQLALFAKSFSGSGTDGGFSRKKKLKKNKSKPKLRPADISYHTCDKKRHWAPKCPKKRESKVK